MSPMRRRRFLGVGLLLAAPLPAKLLGCGGGGGVAADASAETFIIMNEDEADHVHELEITCADLAASQAVTYTATGPHAHTIMLSAEQLGQIAAGETVTVTFTEGHSHTFHIVRPAGACS